MQTPALKPSVRWLLAATVFFGCGIPYYSQPCLSQIAQSAGISQLQMGSLSSLTLAGFVVGLILIVPLADVWEKRRLLVGLFLAESVFLVLFSRSTSYGLFLFSSLGIGLSAVVSQVAIPYVARLSPAKERGRNLGIVLGAAFLGILAARTGSGLIAGAWGWRTTYLLASVVMLLLAFVVHHVLPPDRAGDVGSYSALLRSVWHLHQDLPELRHVAVTGALLYAAVTGFWAVLSFQLGSPQFGLGPGAVGFFGLIGALSALSVSLVGRLADRIRPRLIVGFCICLMVFAFLLMAVWGQTLAGMILGTIFLDVAAQAASVSNQTQIYRLNEKAQSRLNTVYKIYYFFGGAAGTFLATAAWHRWGWTGVCADGLGLLLLATLWQQSSLPVRLWFWKPAQEA